MPLEYLGRTVTDVPGTKRRTPRLPIWTLAITAIVLFLCPGILRKVLAANVTATWSYDYGPQPACSLSKTINCIDHFEIQDITDQENFVLIQKVPNPNPATGKVDHVSASFMYGPPFGKRVISVIAVARGPKGERVTSNPFAARAIVTILPATKASLVL